MGKGRGEIWMRERERKRNRLKFVKREWGREKRESRVMLLPLSREALSLFICLHSGEL